MLSKTLSDALLEKQLDRTVGTTAFSGLGAQSVGKVRDSYVKNGERAIVTTDRISAFDVVLGTIPFKGQILNQIAAHWFENRNIWCQITC